VGAYQVPDDLDLRALARSLDPREPHRTAVVALRAGRGPTLRRRGRPASTDVPLPAGFETLEVGFSDLRTLAEEIVRYAADAVVLSRAELRQQVMGMLTRVTATSQARIDDDDERVSA